ncbi:MAG: DUF805 domain-containing protein [Lactobacillaceae bacterium]|nr:DUF805 domain-containing protein [Lactobacillaceae bacterium]
MLKHLSQELKHRLETTSMMDAIHRYHHFWKRTFDFRGVTHRWDFWVETIMTALLFGLLDGLNDRITQTLTSILPKAADGFTVDVSETIDIVVAVLQVAILIHEVAAIIRRVRAIGFRGWSYVLGIVAFVLPLFSWALLLLPDNWIKNRKKDVSQTNVE